MPSAAFASDVFTWPAEEPQLIGGRCRSCQAVMFPAQASCSRCGTPGMEEHLLPRRGTLWTWTTQEFLPKEPYASGETAETFRPYGVGLVQLCDEVRVEGRLTEADPAKLRIGMEVELVIVPFRVDDDGEVVVYAFAPVADGQACDGATEIGGPLPINTDGGLIANGEPIGASGLRQVHELVRQLRGQAGERQAARTPRVGYAQLYGAPGTAGVSILAT